MCKRREKRLKADRPRSELLAIIRSSLIFPYGPYIGTFANRPQTGNSPEKLEIYWGGHIDYKQQALRKRPGVVLAISYPTSPAGGTGTPQCAPDLPPGKINLRRSGPLTTPPRARKGAPKESWTRGPLEPSQPPRPQPNAAHYPGLDFCFEFF